MTNDEARWWRLYREERLKLGKKWSDTLTPSEVMRAAREATRRFNRR